MESIFQELFTKELLLIISIKSISECIHIELKSTQESQECPVCDEITSSRHCTYTRTVDDLTMIGKSVVLTISVNKFKCKNPECRVKVFCQRIEGFLEKNQQKTERLLEYLRNIAFTNSGECGSRICRKNNLPVSGATLIRLVKSWKPVEIKVKKIGVDDWAYKKNHTYGTLIVDLETHHPIDVLKGSDSETLKEWLKENPQVELISRDRGTSYISAAQGITQVADRFHIMQNFFDSVKEIVTANLPNRVLIKQEYSVETEVSETQLERTSYTLELRKDNIIKAQSLKKSGWKHQQIADELGLSLGTVHRMLKSDVNQVHICPRGAKPALDKYRDFIKKQLDNGCRNYTKIHELLKLEGFKGCYTSVKNYILKMSEYNSKEKILKTYINSNDIIQKIWKGKIFNEEESLIIRGIWDKFDYFSEKVRKFRGLIKNKNLEKLDLFIKEVESDKKNIFYVFVKGLKNDIDAIRNALIYSYNNGLLEGHINRLKVIKRIMYGRAKYDLLRKKVLYNVV
jgi:transposase